MSHSYASTWKRTECWENGTEDRPVYYASVFRSNTKFVQHEAVFHFICVVNKILTFFSPRESDFDNCRFEIFLYLLPCLPWGQPNSHRLNSLGASAEMEISMLMFLGEYLHYQHLWEKKKEVGLGRKRNWAVVLSSRGICLTFRELWSWDGLPEWSHLG